MRYRFDNLELDTEKQELASNDVVIEVEPQVFALLELLISHADRVVGKEELNERIWGGRVVSDAAINSRVKSARAAIGDDGKQQRLIRTVRGRGYRFVGDCTRDLGGNAGGGRGELDTHPNHIEVIARREPEFTTPARKEKPSIAVLPLTLLSLDTRFEPISDAIAHEITADLSRLHWLRVISRASTFKLRDLGDDLDQVAALLGVEYILTGTFGVFGDRATISVTLSNVVKGTAVWADRLESDLGELLALPGQLSTRIANAIELRIQNEEAELGDSLSTEDMDAWTSYFRGLRHAHRFNAHDNAIAQHLFEQALSLDGGFALAHAGLSFVHFQTAFVGYSSEVRPAQALALRHAERAFELDQLDPIASLMMGRAKFLNGDWQQSGPWFERCAQLSPSNALAHYQQGLLGVISGDVEASVEQAMTALSLSPIDPLQYAFLATRALTHLAQDDAEQSVIWADRAANAPRAHHLITAIAAVANQQSGNTAQAQNWSALLRQRTPDFSAEAFFRSFPVTPVLRQRITQQLLDLGFPAS